MTEIPEHLLARSRARKAAASGGAAPVPATTGETSPAAATPAAETAPVAAAPKPEKAEPVLPWVAAADTRRKVPFWAMSALVLLPIWAIVYATTNDPQSPKEAGPLTVGAATYSTCAACHGGAGQGGVGPAFAGGAILKTFPDPTAHIRWVILGTAGYKTEGTKVYGAANKPVGGVGNMPSQAGLESPKLLGVIRHEREVIGGEKFDIKKWEAAAATLVNDKNPVVANKAKEFGDLIKTWATLPPGA